MKSFRSFIVSVLGLIALNDVAFAQLSLEEATEQAWGLHNRLTGVPPSTEVLNQMAALIFQGQTDQAAFVAMQSPYFYTSFILRTFSPDSNRAKLSDVPLTDFTATIAGLVRDNESFDKILYGDVLYTAGDNFTDFDPAASGIFRVIRRTNNQGPVADPTKVRGLLNRDSATNGRYKDNIHFSDLQSKYPVTWQTTLVQRRQSEIYALTSNEATNGAQVNGRVPVEDILGVMTTRQAASEFFSAGTNRRVTQNLFQNFLCAPLEELHDTTRSQAKIRRDVDRSPGGDPIQYLTKCVGCHAGMDALTGAFSFIDYRLDQNRIVYDPAWVAACQSLTPAQVADNPRCKQYRQYNVYPAGHVHVDNSFENFWTEGQNSALGWRLPNGVSSLTSGLGANSVGRILAATESFTNCMAHRSFKSICGRDPTPNEWKELKDLARDVEFGIPEYSAQQASGPYNLKALIAAASEKCFGN